MGTERVIAVRPPGQSRSTGITLGVIGVQPDPAGGSVPESERIAILGAYNPDLEVPEQHRVRAGDEVRVAGHVIRIVSVVSEPFPRVDVVVSRPGISPARL